MAAAERSLQHYSQEPSIGEGPVCAIFGPLEDSEIPAAFPQGYESEEEPTALELAVFARATEYAARQPRPKEEPTSNVVYLKNFDRHKTGVTEETSYDEEQLDDEPDAFEFLDRRDQLDPLKLLVKKFNQINSRRGHKSALKAGRVLPKKKGDSATKEIKLVNKKIEDLEKEAVQIFRDKIICEGQLKVAGLSQDTIDHMAATSYAKLRQKIGPGTDIKSKDREQFLKDFERKLEARESEVAPSDDIPF